MYCIWHGNVFQLAIQFISRILVSQIRYTKKDPGKVRVQCRYSRLENICRVAFRKKIKSGHNQHSPVKRGGRGT